MQTVAELRTFRKHAEAAGMSEEDIEELVAYLGENPDAGDEIQGTGGAVSFVSQFVATTKGKVVAFAPSLFTLVT
ncbi:hypothetical protein [Brucella intermedia]|uniref:hypothetical protein n=1 Tax=Brucella intermedia TaxID=94625 RepID=UPI0031F3161E